MANLDRSSKELFKDFSSEDDDSYYSIDGFDPEAFEDYEK